MKIQSCHPFCVTPCFDRFEVSVIKGRKPKPVEVRRREGNPRKHAMPEPLQVGGRVAELEPPEDLPEDGKDVWKQIVPRLAEVGVLDQVDTYAVEAMCTQWARAKQAGRIIAQQGHVTIGSTGQLVEHPALQTERNAFQQFLRFAEHYALTPVARTRLGLAELERKSLASTMSGALEDSVIEID
jgi:P27 family predicted phage terminase small subunit